MKKRVIALMCIFLIASLPFVMAIDSNEYYAQQQLQAQQFNYPGSSFNTGYSGSLPQNFAGPSYTPNIMDTLFGQTLNSLGSSFSGPGIDLGEGIAVYVDSYQPQIVRESHLEQADVPIFVYLRGYTTGTLLSPLSEDPKETDPLTGISNIPPIEYIQVIPNGSSRDHIRSIQYIKPQRDQIALENLGYLIVYLKKIDQASENIPTQLDLDLNAKIYLRLDEAGLFGATQQDLTLQPETEEEFLAKTVKDDNSFYTSGAYLRLVSIEKDRATFQVYNRDFTPLSFALPGFAPGELKQGLQQRGQVTVTRGGTSSALSLGYTGNPLRDFFKIRLNDIIEPSDKATLTLARDGKTITRKIPKGSKIFAGSSWIVSDVSVSPNINVIPNDIESLPFNYETKQKLRSQEGLIKQIHVVILENIATREKRSLTRTIILSNNDLLAFASQPVDEATSNFLESKYCSSDLGTSNENYACLAVSKLKEIITDYPDSPESKKALKDLAEIYADNLIENPECVAGAVVKCNEYKADMNDLALFYYNKAGIQQQTIQNIGYGGGLYLEDELVDIKLQNVGLLTEVGAGNIVLRVYSQTGVESEETKKIGDAVETGVTGEDGKTYQWLVERIFTDRVSLKLYTNTAGQKPEPVSGQSIILNLNERRPIIKKYRTFNAATNQVTQPEITKDIELISTNINTEAYVTIIPGTERAFVSSPFKVHVGIEPRPFKLTKDQLKDRLKDTQDIINKLDSIISRLDSLVSFWKKSCLVVFLGLTAKNSFLGGNSKNLARRTVSTFYKEKCVTEVLEGQTASHPQFRTQEQCLNNYGDEIESATSQTQSAYDTVNLNLKGKTKEDLKNDAEVKAFLGAGGTIEQYREKLLLDELNKNERIKEIGLFDYVTQKSEGIAYEERVRLYTQAKEVISNSCSGETNCQWKEDDIPLVVDILRRKQTISEDERVVDLDLIKPVLDSSGKETKEATALIPTASGLSFTPKKLIAVSPYALLVYEKGENEAKSEVCSSIGGTYAGGTCSKTESSRTIDLRTQLERQIDIKKNSEKLPQKQRYVEESFMKNGLLVYTSTTAPLPFKFYSTSLTFDNNRILARDYIYSPTEGLPAETNTDGQIYCYPIGEGDYLTILDRSKGTGQIKSIEHWNAGSNRRIECGKGDDVRKNDYSLLESDAGRKLKSQLLAKVRDTRCKEDGQSIGTIDGIQIKCSSKERKLQEELNKPQCIDVMDPSDCKILFNACDPVMCPSSRCTLGGRVPPRNVIQSGIVGSSLLCLPNAAEGVVVPVCLTGIDAGLKYSRSLLQGYADCLEISLETGRDVGVCDYIRSVGICEVLWREGVQLADIGGRGILDWASAKVFDEPKGGVEYLTFQSSLDNVGDSVNYLTEEYSNTFLGYYSSQTSDEIGSQFCRAAVYGKVPSIGGIFDQLTEPEDPPQFTAFFDSAPYADPGVGYGVRGVQSSTRELSLYKVFYHIYAGTGYYGGAGYTEPRSLFNPSEQLGSRQGRITYSVYLVNRELGLSPLYVTFPEQGPIVQQQAYGGPAAIPTGFGSITASIEPGRYQSQTVQKPGVKGYNEICVNINGQEQCGFGKVSTSFGIQEVTELLAKDEATKEINSAADCVPDYPTLAPSLSSLGSLGITQNVPTPETYGLLSTGISRVCNPTLPTPDSTRWIAVGECGEDENGKDRGTCWLDRKSINMNDKEIRGDVYDELQRGETRSIDSETSRQALFKLDQEAKKILSSIEDETNKAKKGDLAEETNTTVE